MLPSLEAQLKAKEQTQTPDKPIAPLVLGIIKDREQREKNQKPKEPRKQKQRKEKRFGKNGELQPEAKEFIPAHYEQVTHNLQVAQQNLNQLHQVLQFSAQEFYPTSEFKSNAMPFVPSGFQSFKPET